MRAWRVAAVAAWACCFSASTAADRVSRDLLVLYDFAEKSGPVVHDRVSSGGRLDLKIRDLKTVRWRGGFLEVRGSALIASSGPARKITDAVRKSGQITIEAWLKPANTSQAGPARIVTLSADSGQRNFTLGQEKNRFDVRLRTTKTDRNGIPSLASSGLATRLTHVVYTRDRGGVARLYVDGKQRANRKVAGDFSKWDRNFKFALANELTRDRTWRGELHLVAVYRRALSVNEVRQNHAAGAKKGAPPVVVAKNSKPKPAPKPDPPKLAKKPVPRKTFALKDIALPGGGKLQQVSFERHVMGLFSRLGCNAGSCHGSFQGQAGFRLSLFGHDPKFDHKALTDEDEGPRVEWNDPAESLILIKATLEEDHGGGKRFEKDSWQYQVLWNWVAAGAPWKPGSGNISKLEISPQEHRFDKPGGNVQLKVTAHYSDGSQEDVTPFSDFRVNDEYVAEVSHEGVVRSVRPGDTAVVVTYRGQVLSARAMVAAPTKPGFEFPRLAENNVIDREVFAKLRKLNMVPSNPASDYEFLRRLYIDTIGTLPSPEEVRAFVRDKDPNKRDKKINELLAHPMHAALWATKFSDITGNDTAALERPQNKRSRMWYDWFRTRLEKNIPYDQLVRGVLLATSREGKKPEEWIKEATALEEVALRSFDSQYHKRETLDLFWSRRNFNMEQMAEKTAAAFMGVRLECAQCHKHPYDRWTQADYRSYANIFGGLKSGSSSEAKKAIDNENRRRKRIKDRKKRLQNLREIYYDSGRPRRLNHPETNRPLEPKTLGGPEIKQVKSGGDPRDGLFTWLTRPDNPFFANSFVNRIWGHYLGVGIVDPVDDFSVANPPSHPMLLEALAKEFVAKKYDIRHIERMILRSRVYQLSSTPNEFNLYDRNNFARSYPRRMMAEVVVDVVNTALGSPDSYSRDGGERAIEVAATQVQDGNLSYVFRIFGRPERTAACDCQRSTDAALPQTLYLMTDSRILGNIAKGRLQKILAEKDRLKKLRSKKLSDGEIGEVVDELFLSTLTRLPDEREKKAAIQNVRRKDGSESGFVDVVWALINTREFILNH